MPVVAPRLVLLVPAALVGLVAAIAVALAAPTPLPLLVGFVVGVVVVAILVVVLDRRAPRAALKALGARPLEPGREPRLESIVESICASHGISEPQLYLVESRAPDAAVVGRPDDTRLVVTTGALRQLERLEIEAIVARELVQFGAGVHAATALASVMGLLGPLAKPMRDKLLDDRRLALTDIEGVRLTRYPPALVGVLEKAATGGGVPDRAATRHLWLIGPMNVAGVVQPPLAERIDTLREL